MQQMVMINSRPQDAYRRQDVMTANGVDLIVMLYDALKKNVILGKKKIEKNELLNAHKHLIKAQEIVSELIGSLDMSYPISEELLAIYDFMISSLRDSNVRKDPQPLQPVLEMADSLRSAWYEISLSNKGNLHTREVQA